MRSLPTANGGDGGSIVCQVCSHPRTSNGRFRKSTAFDRNLITFMKPGGGPLTLIVAYQHSPFSTRVVSVKMHAPRDHGVFPRQVSGRCKRCFQLRKVWRNVILCVSTLNDRNSNNYNVFTASTKTAAPSQTSVRQLLL